jgi:small subunit ribosomal protein S5
VAYNSHHMQHHHHHGDGSGTELQDRVIQINRVAKVVKGGRRFSFSALVVVGDGHNKVGWGLGKANEVPEAVRKATERAKASMREIPLLKGTLPHKVIGRFGAARVLLKPAAPGTGVIAGGALRPILEVAGVRNVLTKILGTRNPHNVIKAAFEGFDQLVDLEMAVARRGISPDKIRGRA